MKVLLVLAAIVAVAYAGVGILTAREEQEAIRLWQQFCSGASDQGSDGSVFVYCKRARENNEETLQHNIEVTPAPESPRQVVFVQPPSTSYKHQVSITGQAGGAQKTTIYVLPQKNSHSVDYSDNRPAGPTPQKPTLFFLKNNPDGSPPSSGPSETTSETDSQSPPGTYLPPKPNSADEEGYRYNAPRLGNGYA